MSDGRLNGWGKILVAVVPLALTGLVAVVLLFGRVTRVEGDLDKKADREVVKTQQEAILRELNEISRQIQELRTEVRASPP